MNHDEGSMKLFVMLVMDEANKARDKFRQACER